MSKFQIILLGVFGVFIVVAVFVFSFFRGGSSGQSVTVTVWGDIPSFDFNSVLNNADVNQDDLLQIRYVEKNPNTIESDFTEALATNTGPDLIILPLNKFWHNRNKILAIPYNSVSERAFKAAFVEQGELYLSEDGVYGLPLTLDPMMLYYNRDLLSRASIAKPISFWDEIFSTSFKLTDKDPAGNIKQSTIALGEALNIPHHKDILALFFLQAGTPVTQFTNSGLTPVISGSFNQTVSPGVAALDFYTQFSNPAKTYYSWNRSLLSAPTNFTSGDSVYYLGFASELRALRNKNPTLNLGVAQVPQSRVSGKSITFAHMRGVSVSRGTKNPSASVSAALKLVSRDVEYEFARTLLLPPPRRDLLVEEPADDVLSIFYSSALISKGWIDPESIASSQIFREMIESVTSGRARTSEAVSRANRELESLIK